jgi:hypothetical protein
MSTYFGFAFVNMHNVYNEKKHHSDSIFNPKHHLLWNGQNDLAACSDYLKLLLSTTFRFACQMPHLQT